MVFSLQAADLTGLDGAGLGALFGFLAAFFVFALIAAIVIYIYVALALMTIAKKTNTANPWMAWIPIANVFLMAKIAKQPWWMALIAILAFIVPMVGGLIAMGLFIFFWWKIAEELKKPGWIAVLFIVPVIGLIVPGYLAWSK